MRDPLDWMMSEAIESLDPSPMDDGDDDGADALDASAPEAPPSDDGVSVAAKHLRGLVERPVPKWGHQSRNRSRKH